MSEYLLALENVSLSYEKQVVADLSFQISGGQVLALVGESGCGKTTLLKALAGLPDSGVAITGGRILYDGRDLTGLGCRERKKLLGGEIAMIFQNPGASFNPIRSYRKQFAEMLISSGGFKGEQSYSEILDCFGKLHLPEGRRILDSCPYEMSGGMNQRVAIAAAMLQKPRLLLADEPTSALDATTQKTAVEELLKMKELTGTSIIIVTHNLGIAAKMADLTGVMYAGRLLEWGDTQKVLRTPAHPYTRSLISAIPCLGGRLPESLEGQPPLYGAEQGSCSFSGRCRYKKESCGEYRYQLKEVSGGHMSCCMEGIEESHEYGS